MAAFNGVLAISPTHPVASGYVEALFTLAELAYPVSPSYSASLVLSGALADTQPITNERQAALNGVQAYGFGFSDWYNRIHYSAIKLALGNIVSDQVVPLLVWNAYFVSKTLSTITTTGDTTGITLGYPSALPITFNALAELEFDYSVTTFGPPSLNVDYLFNWSNAEDSTVTVYGNRINAWCWRPDWASGITERLEWKTGVITNYDGSERRTRLRKYPRRSFEFEYLTDGYDRRFMEASLWNWQSRIWALPIWMDGEPVSSAISLGALSIPCETTNRDYHLGGLAIILRDGGKYEVIEISQVNANSIDLVRPTVKSWTAGEAWVYPTRAARMTDETGLSRFTGGANYGRARFELAEATDIVASAGTLYRGAPVVSERSNWDDDIEATYRRKISTLDYDIALPIVDDESGIANVVQRHRWLLTDRASIAVKKSLLQYLSGKWKSIWLPTWADDLISVDTIQTAQTYIDVEHNNYSLHYSVAPNRRDIRIELFSGAVYYRHINSVTELSSTVERLALNSSLGVTVPVSNIRQISFMALARLDSDAIELAYWQGDTAEISVKLSAARNVD